MQGFGQSFGGQSNGDQQGFGQSYGGQQDGGFGPSGGQRSR